MWGESIVEVHQDRHGVDATLTSGDQIRSDILVGADGLHSAVGRLVLAPEDFDIVPLGMWIATLPYAAAGIDPRTVRVYNEPGRMAALHPAGGHPGAALMLRAPAPRGRDLRVLERHADVGAAFAAYERAQRRHVAPHQRGVQLAIGLSARNAVLRAGDWLSRRGARPLPAATPGGPT